MKANPIPKGYRTVTPFLVVRGGAKAIEFYQKAFGAQVTERVDAPDGTVSHAALRVGDSMFMLVDEDLKNSDQTVRSPATLKGSTVLLYVYIDDVDKLFDRAVKAGARVKAPVADMFWGDRHGQVEDPFGHLWSLSTRKEDLTPEQIQQRAREALPPRAAP